MRSTNLSQKDAEKALEYMQEHHIGAANKLVRELERKCCVKRKHTYNLHTYNP